MRDRHTCTATLIWGRLAGSEQFDGGETLDLKSFACERGKAVIVRKYIARPQKHKKKLKERIPPHSPKARSNTNKLHTQTLQHTELLLDGGINLGQDGAGTLQLLGGLIILWLKLFAMAAPWCVEFNQNQVILAKGMEMAAVYVGRGSAPSTSM